MQQIVNFLIRHKTFITFFVLFCFSLFLVVQSHSYHNTKFVNSANWVSGGIYNTTNNIGDYLYLKQYNQQLIEENSYLRKQLLNRDIPIEDSLMDPNALDKKFKIRPASIIKNSYNKLHNYLLVDKGNKDSVVQDMGVITSKGIVGIIENTSSNYANVQSVLNTFSEINAAIKNTNNFG